MVEGLADALSAAVVPAGVIAAVAAGDGGDAVKLSDGCSLDGRCEIGPVTRTLTGVLLAALAGDGIVALDDQVGRWPGAGQNPGMTLGQLATHTPGLPGCRACRRVTPLGRLTRKAS